MTTGVSENSGVNVEKVDHIMSVGGRAPHKADVIDGILPHQRHAIAVTEEHGLQVHDINIDPESFPNPVRVTGERRVSDLDSFLAELNRRPLPAEGTLWGQALAGRLTAVYNDHDGDVTKAAGWRDDKLVLALTPDEDWKAWHAMSGTYYSQNEFGDRVEELLHTVLNPDQAELLEVIDSIRASTSGEFESRIERANGGQKLTYKQEHSVTAGRAGQLEVPQTITLELRPWENHPQTYHVEAYFRTRVNAGNLGIAIKLKPTRQIVREAWQAVTSAVYDGTQKPVYAVV